MLNILERLQSDFFVLDDGSIKCDFAPLMKFINRYFDDAIIVSLEDKVKALSKDFVSSLLKIDKDTNYITVGEGGERILKYIDWIDNSTTIALKFSRAWTKNCETNFTHNFNQFYFSGKEFVIVEDVIASGKTLESVSKQIECRGGKIKGIITATISGTSPLNTFNDNYNIIACASLESSYAVSNYGSFEAHWFPGIYSLRHLFRGDEENPNFYPILSEKYFHGEDIRPFLKVQ